MGWIGTWGELAPTPYSWIKARNKKSEIYKLKPYHGVDLACIWSASIIILLSIRYKNKIALQKLNLNFFEILGFFVVKNKNTPINFVFY